MARRGVMVRVARSVAMLVLAVFVALLALLPGLGRPAQADTGDDPLVVYCLSPARRTGLLEAAAALGLARRDNAGGYLLPDNTPLDPASWRRDHHDDFVRTCEALYAAERTPEPGVWAALLPFLTALTGAVLAFAAASWRDRVARGHALADGLRSAFTGYSRAVEAALDGGVDRAEVQEQAVERRYGLLLELAKVKAAHRTWPVVAAVEAEIELRRFDRTGAYGPDDAAPGKDDEAEKKAARAWLKSAKDRVFWIAHALDHPSPRNRAMAGAPAGDS